jgi:transcriptional regulator with XRE-family HTH domain
MNNVRALRNARYLTQAQLAMLLGILPQTVGTWEREEKVPRMRMRRKLARVLKVSEEELGFDSVAEEDGAD